MPIITGTDGGEQILGTAGNDEIDALGGDDHISARGGEDTVDGGSGSDTVYFGSTGAAVTVTSTGGRIVIAEAGVQSVSAVNVESFAIVAGDLATAGLTVDASQVDVPISFTLHDYYANTIIGSSGNNVFSRTQGLAGYTHTLTGGGGSDRYEFYTDLNSMAGVTILDFDIDDTIHVLPMIAASYVGLDPLDGAGDYRNYTAGGQTFIVADGGTTVLTIASGAFAIEETAPGSNVLRIARQSLTEGDDGFDGGPLGSAVFALGGNDVLNGGGGNDWLYGGEGDDRLIVSAGHDTVDGGNGADVLVLDWSDSTNNIYWNNTVESMSGGETGRFVDGSGRSVTLEDIESIELTTGSGDDYLRFHAGTIRSGDGNDTVLGWDGPLDLHMGAGDDLFWSGDGADVYDGGEGFDALSYAFSGAVTVTLGSGAGDVGTSSDGDVFSNVERVAGSAYNDTIHGSEIDDQLVGDQGDDTVNGNGGQDFVSGGTGDDVLHGGDGNDLLYPMEGIDAVYGEAGDDQIFTSYVSSGDSFDGGSGSDFLMFSNSTSLISGSTEIIALFAVEITSIERLGLDSRPDAGMHVMMLLDQFVEAGLTELSGGLGRDAFTLAVTGSPGANVTASMPDFTIINWAPSPTPHIASSVVDYLALAGTIFVGQPSPNYTLHAREGLGVTQTLSGATGNDTLVGSSGVEYLFAFGGGADLLQGAGGDDVLVASNSNFLGTVTTSTWAGGTFDGGGGTDIFSVGGVVNFAAQLAAIEHIYLQPSVTTTAPDGSGSQAVAHLTIGAEQLAGLTGNLTLSGTGAITVNLAPGDSYDASGYVVENGAAITHVVNGSTAGDTIVGLDTADTLNGGDGNDRLVASDGHDTIDGGGGDDVLVIDWSDTGEDVLSDYDDAWPSGGTSGIFTSGSGRSVSYSNIESVDITTGSGNDRFYVPGGIIHSGGGNDYVVALGGPVEFHGGDGGDQFASSDAADIFDGGAGDDRVEYASADAGVTVSLGLLDGDTGTASDGDQLRSVESLIGSAFGDVLNGSNGNNFIAGYTGNDVIDGKGGNDTLEGGDGDDSLSGGTGDDWFNVRDPGDLVFEAAGEGYDRIYAMTSYTLAAGQHVEWMTVAEYVPSIPAAFSLTGNELANRLDGNSRNNTLNGGAGNDTLNGGIGNDVMNGGAGNDVIYVDAAGDFVQEAAAGGSDLVYTSVSYTLTAGAEVETLSTSGLAATTAINLIGNAFAQLIYGNAGVNTLNGAGGDDTLVGLAGNDTLIGNTGNDTMNGGLGNDVIHVDAAGDIVQEAAAGGSDLVYTSVSYTLTAGAEIETLSTNALGATTAIDLTGNAFGQVIYGNAGANVLDGGGGNDTLVGLGGNDTYRVDAAGDTVHEAAAKGNDIVYASVSYTLLAGQEVETLSTNALGATAAISLTGNELTQTITGNAGANGLNGAGGNDTLIGLAGNDTLNGGTGNDTMNGGIGNDTYHVDAAGDVVQEAAAGGSDLVYASVTYTLTAGAEVETLSTNALGATTAINLTGNALGQVIYGNAGVNSLNGGGGNDTLIGLAGNDVLNGSVGNDTMNGGAGNDVIHVDAAGDIVQEAAAGGTDVVYASVTYTLTAGAEVETLSTNALGATTAINLTGNALGQVLYGNAGANVLNGLGGNDTLVGLGGMDSFAFTTALGAGNVDAISGFSVADDTILLENAVFTGLGAGALAAGAFNTGASASQLDDRIVYNSATGALLFDADGSGAGAAVQFATLAGGLALTASDFLVV